jgi:hypothetical protein
MDRGARAGRLAAGCFSFIMFIFTLVEPGTKEAPPVLTIPAG